jgi:hypothetical protein
MAARRRSGGGAKTPTDARRGPKSEKTTTGTGSALERHEETDGEGW